MNDGCKGSGGFCDVMDVCLLVMSFPGYARIFISTNSTADFPTTSTLSAMVAGGRFGGGAVEITPSFDTIASQALESEAVTPSGL